MRGRAVSEYDAAMLVGMTEDEYARGGAARTAVVRFEHAPL